MKQVTENVLEAEWTRLVLDEPRVDARFVELMTTIENSQFLQKTNLTQDGICCLDLVSWVLQFRLEGRNQSRFRRNERLITRALRRDATPSNR